MSTLGGRFVQKICPDCDQPLTETTIGGEMLSAARRFRCEYCGAAWVQSGPGWPLSEDEG